MVMRGVKDRDLEQVRAYNVKAAELGCVAAQYNLGIGWYERKVIEWQKLQHTLLGSKITIPAAAPQMQGMLFTNIQVYGEHKLKDYHCGLTSPILWPEPIVEGQEWQFNYRLEKSPCWAQ